MKIKEKPEEFIVEEIPREFSGKGEYLIIRVKKKNKNTEEVADMIAKALNTNRKKIGYAGAKDRKAITTQYFSIRINKREEEIEKILDKTLTKDPEIRTEIITRDDKPITLGEHKGNKFRIIVKDLEEPLGIGEKEIEFPNYFGPQRFGRENHIIGKLIIKKEFRKAAERIGIKPDEPIRSLRDLPRKTVMIYLHAYQSWLWNKTTSLIIEKTAEEKGGDIKIDAKKGLVFAKEYMIIKERIPDKIPIIGFGLEEEDIEENKVLKRIMKEEKITLRDFIIKELPRMSLEGGERDSIIKTKVRFSDFKVHKQIVEFSLPPGSYATTLLDQLIQWRELYC